MNPTLLYLDGSSGELRFNTSTNKWEMIFPVNLPNVLVTPIQPPPIPVPVPVPVPVPSPTPVPSSYKGIDALLAIKDLRIPTGPYEGGYEVAPNGKLNWYFANLGLTAVINKMTQEERLFYIVPYLNLYLSNIDLDCRIQDVEFPSGRADTSNTKKMDSDSDDSYAATFLTLVQQYFKASNDLQWVLKNLPALKNIAYANIASSVKINGLTSVFAGTRSSKNSIGYLMDNCEVYRGLRDFAIILKSLTNADAAYYDSFATGIANAILKELYIPTDKAFTPSDANPTVTTSFYPGATCQVYPQVFGLTELASTFNDAWLYFNNNAPAWEQGKLDAFPWAILGYAAALNGEKELALAQMKNTESVFLNNSSLTTINELGFYLKTKDELAL